jgi:hypothetical protein
MSMSVKRASREHLSCVLKLRRFNSSRNPTKERNHNNGGFEATKFRFGSNIITE